MSSAFHLAAATVSRSVNVTRIAVRIRAVIVVSVSMFPSPVRASVDAQVAFAVLTISVRPSMCFAAPMTSIVGDSSGA